MRSQLNLLAAAALVTGALGLSAAPSFAAGTVKAHDTAALNHDTAHNGIIPLRDVHNPKDTLGSVKIEDMAGHSIGSVDDVMLDNNGKVKQIKADVGGFLGVGSKDVALNANALKFDPNKKVLITSMTKDQLKALPSVKG